jgi:hypothetical protein
MKTKYILFALFVFLLFDTNGSQAQSKKSAIKLARVKYSGGGDWYNDPSGEVNLLSYVAKNTNINVDPVYEYVDLASDNLFSYPIIFLTGHGNINFTDKEAKNLRAYLQNGGFLYIDDDYGLDPYIRKEMKKVFPEQDFAEIPYSHGIYKAQFDFSRGLPKIHEHDKDAPPKGYGLFYDNRLCVFYTFETNISDGWVDPDVHKDTPETREKALKMGTNIVVWALSN